MGLSRHPSPAQSAPRRRSDVRARRTQGGREESTGDASGHRLVLLFFWICCFVDFVISEVYGGRERMREETEGSFARWRGNSSRDGGSGDVSGALDVMWWRLARRRRRHRRLRAWSLRRTVHIQEAMLVKRDTVDGCKPQERHERQERLHFFGCCLARGEQSSSDVAR